MPELVGEEENIQKLQEQMSYEQLYHLTMQVCMSTISCIIATKHTIQWYGFLPCSQCWFIVSLGFRWLLPCWQWYI